jgi:hypothetical protein
MKPGVCCPAPVCCPPLPGCPVASELIMFARALPQPVPAPIAMVPPVPCLFDVKYPAPRSPLATGPIVIARPPAPPVPPLPGPPMVRMNGAVVTAPTCDVVTIADPAREKRVAYFKRAYQDACDAGLPDLAREMALRCLELDPTCFNQE